MERKDLEDWEKKMTALVTRVEDEGVERGGQGG